MVVTFTGHRPGRSGQSDRLAGFDAKHYEAFSGYLDRMLEEKLKKETDVTFITGGAQGVDQLAFWSAQAYKERHPEKKVKNELFIPFKGQENGWQETGTFSKAEYRAMVKAADEVRIVGSKGQSRDDVVKALMDRNIAMIDEADLLIPVVNVNEQYPPEKGGTSQAIRYAKRQGKRIFPINYRIDQNGCMQGVDFRGLTKADKEMRTHPEKVQEKKALAAKSISFRPSQKLSSASQKVQLAQQTSSAPKTEVVQNVHDTQNAQNAQTAQNVQKTVRTQPSSDGESVMVDKAFLEALLAQAKLVRKPSADSKPVQAVPNTHEAKHTQSAQTAHTSRPLPDTSNIKKVDPSQYQGLAPES